MIFEEQSTIEHMVFRILTHTQSLIQCQRVQVLVNVNTVLIHNTMMIILYILNQSRIIFQGGIKKDVSPTHHTFSYNLIKPIILKFILIVSEFC